jgi:hypothetical protein
MSLLWLAQQLAAANGISHSQMLFYTLIQPNHLVSFFFVVETVFHEDAVIAAMPTAQAHPFCAVCNVGRSSDRVLLQCQNHACSSGEWFHSQCIGSAIVSLNVKKTQHRWLCPWCLLQQSSSLSERQILALTLHISHLDSMRSNTARPVEHLASDTSSTNHPIPSLTSGSGACSSIDISAPIFRSSSCSKKRSIAPRDVSAYLGTSDNELSGTCAKCRRTYFFTRYVLLRDCMFTALRLVNGMRHPKRINDNGLLPTSDSQLKSPDPQPGHTAPFSCLSSGTGFSTPSDLRSARASFRRNSSSLLAEFDSSTLKFSSSLSFKNPSAFSQCWRQGRSQMHGWGLFANEFIPPGQRITEYALFLKLHFVAHF